MSGKVADKAADLTPPPEHFGRPATPERLAATNGGTPRRTDSQLAVLLRQQQWALDHAAHNLPDGRLTSRERAELARRLEMLAAIVRASMDGAP